MLIQRSLSQVRNFARNIKLQMQQKDKEARIKETIHTFRTSLEDFLEKVIQHFRCGWPDSEYLSKESRTTNNFIRSTEMILRNMIHNREIQQDSPLGDYLYQQFEHLPALIKSATAIQNEYYETQNAQGHYPPRYNFYNGYEFGLLKDFIEPMKPSQREEPVENMNSGPEQKKLLHQSRPEVESWNKSTTYSRPYQTAK